MREILEKYVNNDCTWIELRKEVRISLLTFVKRYRESENLVSMKGLGRRRSFAKSRMISLPYRVSNSLSRSRPRRSTQSGTRSRMP
jgi:hypothetical protein